MAFSINSLFSTNNVSPFHLQRLLGETLLYRASEQGDLVPQNYPLWSTPRSGFIDNPLCTIHFQHAAPPPQHTVSIIRWWHRHSRPILANRHYIPPAHSHKVHIAPLFYPMETTSQYSQNGSHSTHSTSSCYPNTSPLPTHCYPVELPGLISRSTTRPKTPVHETFNIRTTKGHWHPLPTIPFPRTGFNVIHS